MIELVIKNYLDGHLNVPSFFEFPMHKVEQFIVIEKIRSLKQNRLKSSTFVFQSNATSMYDAALLNEQIKDIIEQMIELDVISRISLDSDYNFTDTEMKLYRYQAVFDITHY